MRKFFILPIIILVSGFIFSFSANHCMAAVPEAPAFYNSKKVLDSLDIDSSRGAWWYGGLAMEDYESRNYEAAILNFSKAIFIDPDVPEFYYYRGNSYAFLKKADDALFDFKSTLELNPDYSFTLNNLGWKYFKNRDFLSSFKYFFNYVLSVIKDPKLLFGMNLNSDYLSLLNNLGWESLRNELSPKAIRYFNNYLKLAPLDPDAYLGLSLIYYNYGDFENAATYLDDAKNLEPSLYQGVSGLTALEKTGCVYTIEDKIRIKALFLEVGNKERDFQKLTTASAWKFLLGFTYMVLGILALIIFLLRVKKGEGYILYLSILNLAFGFKFLYDNPLIQLSILPTLNFWIYSMPIISALIPIAFILFLRYFIGWGWKYSILWLLIYSVFQGVVKIIAEYSAPAQDIYGTTNIIFGWLAVIVLFLHLFLPNMRKNREVQIIGAGLGFYLIAIFYKNLVLMHWFSSNVSFDDPAYLFFNICLVYVAFRRITNTEKEFLAVKQDLETARNIQNGILPGENPKGAFYEVSSAYLPMALIGGDYYDYQMQNESHIGVLIADVSGHGISAALIASMVKVAFTSQFNNAHKPALVLQQMNRSLTDQLNNEFITAGYFSIDFKHHKLTYSSAGHPPLIIYRRNDDEIVEIKVPGIPIGIFAETNYKDTTRQLIKGDRLIFYTDGILDVFSPSGEDFGRIRFIDMVRETKNLFADDAISSILKSVQKWSGNDDAGTYGDDITIIIFDIL